MKQKLLLWLGITMALVACEKAYQAEDITEHGANVILRVAAIEQIPFDNETETRADEPVTELCSRLNFVVCQDGEKVKALAQKQGDKDYGTAAFSLPEGTYTLAVIGHNSGGTCTVTSLDKITFKDNLVTDTYLYCGELQVSGESTTVELELRRVVAMFRLVLTDDAIPADVRQMQFYYTGGSSTLSALTGYGSVNSRQTVKIDAAGRHQFDVYTFPHQETGELKMVISALDASGEVIRQRTLENVPVTRNRITRYTGEFFGGMAGETASVALVMSASADWDGEDENHF